MFQSGQPPPIAAKSSTRMVPNVAFLFLFLWIVFAIFLKEKAKNHHLNRTSSTQIAAPNSFATMQLNKSNGVIIPPE